MVEVFLISVEDCPVDSCTGGQCLNAFWAWVVEYKQSGATKIVSCLSEKSKLPLL